MKRVIGFICISVLLIVLCLVYFNTNLKTDVDNAETERTVLQEIEGYQTQYWDIIKRHNMFIQIAETDIVVERDKEDLNKLYAVVKSKINKDNKFLNDINDLNNKYSKEITSAQTQMEMNLLSDEYVENTDAVLNKVYQEIKIKAEHKDFEALKEDEIKWINELEAYQKYIEKQDFGSILGLLYSKTTQDIKHFRTLLLIFYLEQIS